MNKLRLRKERISRDWTQIDVAEKLGVSPQVVCDWEKGRRFPRRPVLLKLERLFGLSHQQLFAPDADEDPFSSTN
ncbi:MAG: helix-turn-helix transcriptional regulator [Eubacteriales bacterium]|nr:helix-turn-helix transcriptional regulator [Eubacteriales bacterium]